MGLNVNLNSPHGFLALLLFGGILLVLLGNGVQTFTTDATLVNDGWIVVGVSIALWILAGFLGFKQD